VPNGRITGTYSNLTGTGALDAGEITSNFGNINIGTSTFTGNGSGLTSVNADTLDSLDSTSFVRSDANDDVTGLLNISRTGEMLKISDTSATGSPYVGFYQGATRRGYIQFVNGGTMRIASDQYASRLDIGNGTTGLTYTDGTTWTVWHSGNDGSGSGLDADLLDGVNSASFLRSDVNDSFSGTLSGAGTISITGNITANAFTGDGSGLTGISADDANTLDGLDSTQFLRSDANDSFSGTLDAGSGNTAAYRFNGRSFSWNSAMQTPSTHIPHVMQQTYTGWDPVIGIKTTDGFWQYGAYSSNILHLGYMAGAFGGHAVNGFDQSFQFQSTGTFIASGEVTAYSDARLKDNVKVIADPLTKILSIRGVTFTRNDQADTDKVHMGVIAQEVEQYFPEVVNTMEDGTKTVNYGAMAGAFIEAFKEQQSQIDELRAMVQKLLDK
jgi:hypothetical protein